MSENPRYGASSRRGGTCVRRRGQCGRGSVPWRCRKEGRTAAKDGQVLREGLHERRTEERPDSVGSCFRFDWHDVYAQCVVNTGASSGSGAGDKMPTRRSADKDGSADKSDEKTWRKRITDARESLQRSQAFADALQSQLNALSTDFVNRDDPIQRQQIANKRDGVLAELDRVKKEVASQTKAISDIQEEARRANVPAGWVR